MKNYLNLAFIALFLLPINSHSADLTQEEVEVSEEFCETAIITPLKRRMDGGSESEIRRLLQLSNQESDYEVARLQRYLTKYLNESLKVKIYPKESVGILGNKNMDVLEAFHEKHMPVCLSEFRAEMINMKEMGEQSKKEGQAASISLTHNTSQTEINQFTNNICQYYLKSPIREKITGIPESKIKDKINGNPALNTIYNKYVTKAYQTKVHPIIEKAKNTDEIERFYNANVADCKKEVSSELQSSVASLKRQAQQQQSPSLITFTLNNCGTSRCIAMRVRSADGRQLNYSEGSLGEDSVRGVHVTPLYQGTSLVGSYQVEVDFVGDVSGKYNTCQGTYHYSGRAKMIGVTISAGSYGECLSINFY